MTPEQLQDLVRSAADHDRIRRYAFGTDLSAKNDRQTQFEVSRDEPAAQPGIIPEGESGMLLTVWQGERVFRKKLICRISITHMTK